MRFGWALMVLGILLIAGGGFVLRELAIAPAIVAIGLGLVGIGVIRRKQVLTSRERR